VTGDDLRPKTPKLWITQPESYAEGVAEIVGAFEELLLFAGKSKYAANESLRAARSRRLHSDQILLEDGIFLQVAADTCKPFFIGRAIGQEIEIRRCGSPMIVEAPLAVFQTVQTKLPICLHGTRR
jgi:hypothetical protein